MMRSWFSSDIPYLANDTMAPIPVEILLGHRKIVKLVDNTTVDHSSRQALTITSGMGVSVLLPSVFLHKALLLYLVLGVPAKQHRHYNLIHI